MFYIIFIISFLFSEDFLKGHVFDSFNNPINNVNVEIPGEDLGTSTDVEGFFIINISGHETLKFSHIAFDYKVIHLSDFEEYNITVFLESKDIKLDRIVVTGTKSARHIKNTPILTHVITNSEINDASYSGVKDMLEIAMPNVQMVASNHGDDRVKVQGLDNKYLTFFG
ncbi:carboxypeptidase-like regulatory domain-containing protein [Candidatus Marinimicrobia bacterium]|nr:carboxypeptidase-like regulatory domain-containing protein [Candidatus Neomarinimicrobiota bacterium]